MSELFIYFALFSKQWIEIIFHETRYLIYSDAILIIEI